MSQSRKTRKNKSPDTVRGYQAPRCTPDQIGHAGRFNSWPDTPAVRLMATSMKPGRRRPPHGRGGADGETRRQEDAKKERVKRMSTENLKTMIKGVGHFKNKDRLMTEDLREEVKELRKEERKLTS